MRQLVVLSLFAIAATIPASLSAQRPPAAPDPERAAVQAVITDFATKIQANNLAGIDSLFPTRGGHILADSVTTHGWVEYRDRILKPELARYSALRYEHTAVEAVVRGNVAWVAFRRLLSNTNSATPPVQGRGTAVLEKLNNRWTIVHLHVSQ